MKKLTPITIDKDKSYLSEVYSSLTEIGTNCIISKETTGCGLTTLAITSKDEPYVIAVPFVSLIENKCYHYNKPGEELVIIPVYGKVNKNRKELKEAILKSNNPKIMVTYDSLEYVTEVLNDKDDNLFNNLIKDFHILIDEYHLLFTQYSFREAAVKKIIENYTKYKTFCFATATMLEEEFLLNELKDIPIQELKWENKVKININSKKIESESTFSKTKISNLCENYVLELIDKYLTNTPGYEGNAYFFVNSLTFINRILNSTKDSLNDSNCRLIYSSNNQKEFRIKRGYTYENPKKINFLTSTAFEGNDIYDKNANTIIVSSAQDKSSLVNIETSFWQIGGRVRDAINKDILHIYSSTRYSEINSDEEFQQMVKDDINEVKKDVIYYNEKSLKYKKTIILNNPYITKNEIKDINGNIIDYIFKFDENLVKIDKFNYKVLNFYSVCINSYGERGNLENSTIYKLNKQNILSVKDRVNEFKTAVIERKRIDNDGVITGDDMYFIKATNKKYTFLQDAINTLGYNKIEEMNYVITNIKNALIQKSDVSYEYKIQQMLSTTIKLNNSYTFNTLKKLLKRIYSEIGITKTAKATDINKYYVTKVTSIREYDKKNNFDIIVGGFQIISNKLYFN